MRSDWLVFCDFGFQSALWCPLSAPTVLLGFLWPCTWGISWQPRVCPGPWGVSSRPPHLTRDVGRLLTAPASDPGRGASPLSRRVWPGTWGVSFWLLTAPVLCSCRSPLTKKAHIQIKISLDIFFALIFVLVLLFNEGSKGFSYTILKFISSSLAFSMQNVKYCDGQKICSGFSEKPRWTFWPPRYLKVFTFII